MQDAHYQDHLMNLDGDHSTDSQPSNDSSVGSIGEIDNWGSDERGKVDNRVGTEMRQNHGDSNSSFFFSNGRSASSSPSIASPKLPPQGAGGGSNHGNRHSRNKSVNVSNAERVAVASTSPNSSHLGGATLVSTAQKPSSPNVAGNVSPRNFAGSSSFAGFGSYSNGSGSGSGNDSERSSSPIPIRSATPPHSRGISIPNPSSQHHSSLLRNSSSPSTSPRDHSVHAAVGIGMGIRGRTTSPGPSTSSGSSSTSSSSSSSPSRSPASPRLHVFGTSAHARRTSSGSSNLAHPHPHPHSAQSCRSPLLAPQSPRFVPSLTEPINPDPEHAWDSVWPSESNRHLPSQALLSSSASASPSSSPSTSPTTAFQARNSPSPNKNISRSLRGTTLSPRRSHSPNQSLSLSAPSSPSRNLAHDFSEGASPVAVPPPDPAAIGSGGFTSTPSTGAKNATWVPGGETRHLSSENESQRSSTSSYSSSSSSSSASQSGSSSKNSAASSDLERKTAASQNHGNGPAVTRGFEFKHLRRDPSISDGKLSQASAHNSSPTSKILSPIHGTEAKVDIACAEANMSPAGEDGNGEDIKMGSPTKSTRLSDTDQLDTVAKATLNEKDVRKETLSPSILSTLSSPSLPKSPRRNSPKSLSAITSPHSLHNPMAIKPTYHSDPSTIPPALAPDSLSPTSPHTSALALPSEDLITPFSSNKLSSSDSAEHGLGFDSSSGGTDKLGGSSDPLGSSPFGEVSSSRSPLQSPKNLPAFAASPSYGFGGSESPPKTRSFIEMPPRSGYDLSDDPDDVGSEEEGSIGSGKSNNGSVGTNEDADQEFDEEMSNDDADDETGVDDEEISRRRNLSRRRGSSESSGSSGSSGEREINSSDRSMDIEGHQQEETEENLEEKSRAQSHIQDSSAPRPNFSKRPSLTRASAVPQIPSTPSEPPATVTSNEAIQEANMLAARLAASRGPDSQGQSVLSYFQDNPAQRREGLSDEAKEPASATQEVGAPQGENQDGDSEMLDDTDSGSGGALGLENDYENQQQESNLNTLERIFLFAKSEMAYHRVLVSRQLAEWIVDVELSEAVEYVIPLLNGLGTDEVDVCAAFAPEIHRILWFFFRNCPLVEVEDDGSSKVNPETTNETETATRPKIHVSSFSPLLCALLLNQNTTIANAAQISLVYFMARLHTGTNASLPRHPDSSEEDQDSEQEQELIKVASGRDSQIVPHEPYSFGPKARAAIELEFLDNVAFQIANLNADISKDGQDASMGDGSKPRNGNVISSMEIPFSTVDDPDSSRDSDMHEPSAIDGWKVGGSPFNASSPAPSTYAKEELDEEAAVGRMASVSFLSAIAAEGIVAPHILATRFVPEVVGMVKDPAFFVRKEVAVALGCLVKWVEEKIVVDTLIPAFDTLVEDKVWHVRQAACMSMPSLFSTVDRELRRERVIPAFRSFVNDVSRNVRSAALEMIGESIYLFHEDPRGVPRELIRFFLAEPFDEQSEEDRDSKVSESSAPADEGNGSLYDEFGFGTTQVNGNGEPSSNGWDSDFTMLHRSDPERPMIIAFNFPAVALTLGQEGWPRIRPTYSSLFEDHDGAPGPGSKILHSLASSIHEMAKIVGPDASKQDLVPFFDRLLHQTDNQLKAAVMENLDVFLLALPREEAENQLKELRACWTGSFARDWHLRERLTQHICSLAPHLVLEDEDGSLVELMQLALGDPVSAVRAAGVQSVPTLYRLFAEGDQVIADGFLSMIADLGQGNGYRIRTACLMAIQALIEAKIQRSSFEVVLLRRLIELRCDPVIDVRIALARTVALMCQHDELYALPQSRSAELLDLLRTLARDRCADVSAPIISLLSIQEGQALGVFDSEGANMPQSPTEPSGRPSLVLGPADGGPHKLASSNLLSQQRDENSSEPFLMDETNEDVTMDDVDIGPSNEDDDDGSWIDPDSSMSQDNDDEEEETELASPHDRDGLTSWNAALPDQEQIPHGNQSVSAMQYPPNASAARNKAFGLLSLSSPDKSAKEGKGTSTAQGSEDTPASNSGAARVPSDPFLEFVVDRTNADPVSSADRFHGLLSPGAETSKDSAIRFNDHASSNSASTSDAVDFSTVSLSSEGLYRM